MNDQYTELYQSFQWLVPTQFSIAQACVYRWAENTLEGRRIAIYYERDDGQRDIWTYTRVSDIAQKLANGFIKMGVVPGDRIALALGQRPEGVATLMAILSVGAVAVPLPGSLGVDGAIARLRDCGARIAVVDTASGPDIIQAQARCPTLTQIIAIDFQHDTVMSWRTLLARQNNIFKPLNTRATSPAVLLYTAGGTGTPKGVLLSHATLIGTLPGFVAAQNWFPQQNDIFWTSTEWSGVGLFGGLLPALYFGHAVVATAPRPTPAMALDIIGRYRVSNAHVHAGLLNEMAQTLPTYIRPENFPLRALSCSAETLTASTLAWSKEALGVTVNETYGQTEAHTIIGNSHRRWPVLPGSIGRAFPGHRVAVLDAAGRPCRPGAVGEIAVRRTDIHGHADPVLFLGYWQDDARTQSRFSGDWYLTGDMASVDGDGYFWFAGRSDDVIHTAGHRIGPAEIEACLKSHSAVDQAAVIGKADPGHGALVKAYVVLRPDARGDDSELLRQQLREHVRTQLPAYQTPREIEFVDSLPCTSAGTLRRHVLRARESQRTAQPSIDPISLGDEAMG
ncbi:AMP-binding protein [Pusillimonas sp. TS35]|uniref:acyl-CoA synthetase n=1 Tax=Paracandidimonas lactea TaxID=2895524 RepID=UPI00136A0260|nr:AMP-binding protein [Paracandidimonas lactea]MYN11544.1 AMP-binding protein [Pusillimonas sp. TS35]